MNKFIALFLLSAAFSARAQQQKNLTMTDAMWNVRSSLAPQTLYNLQFIYGTERYVQLKDNGQGPAWYSGSLQSQQEEPFLSLTQLNRLLTAAGRSALQQMPAITFDEGPAWKMSLGGELVSYDPQQKKFSTLLSAALAGKAKAEQGNAGYTAYLENFNLFVSDGKQARQLTTDGSADIVYASSVHRDEFGISKGTFWSNSGRKLAFYRMDQRMVSDYPIIDWTVRPAKNINIKYPMAGDKSHEVTIGVYDTAVQKVVWLQTGEPAEQYLTNIAWSPDDRYVYVAVLNRGQNHMQLKQFDARTGAFLKVLFEEKDDKYVEPLVPMLFLKNDPQRFIWQSNRDGWNHLYLYTASGKLLRQLTRGKWEVTEVKGFDASAEHLFYMSTAESPVTRNLYSLNLKTGVSRRLTAATGVHQTQESSSGKTIIDRFSTTVNPGTIQLSAAEGKSRVLLQSADPLKDFALGKSGIFTIRGSSGDPLYCNLYQPVNMDSTKKHPVIVYWYGGSHAQLVLDKWNAGAGNYWFQYLAERGYVVLVVDVRGSDNRGKAFEQSMFREVGKVQMEDMMTAVDYLKSLPYTDPQRMGLFGWSFGGFNTVDFMLHHPGVFKAAVAGGAVTNWNFYEVMYTERYMDTPQENPAGYAATNLMEQIGNLQGKLLLIHGLQDNVVLQQHTVDLVKKAVDQNIQLDYMIYPGHEHNVLGKDRTHLYQKVTDYLMQNLK